MTRASYTHLYLHGCLKASTSYALFNSTAKNSHENTYSYIQQLVKFFLCIAIYIATHTVLRYTVECLCKCINV